MIFPPSENDVRAFLTRCVRNGDVRDVRKMNAALDDAEVEDANRERLREAQRQSRARRSKKPTTTKGTT